MLPTLALISAYLIGSIPFGLLLSRWHGLDIRKTGSGNIGATNVVRSLGPKIGILAFVFDFLKGVVPTLVARLYTDGEWLPVAAGLLAIVGHMFPVWLGFRGGKGVATGAGVVLVLLPGPTGGALLVWLTVFCALRYVSLASLVGAASLVSFRLISIPTPFANNQRILTVFTFLSALLVVIRHRENVLRLARGSEHRFAETRVTATASRVIHVLALALWFGAGVFFTFIATLLLFGTLERLGSTPVAERPAGLPLPASFDKMAGTRLAGELVAPMFPRYFALQAACAFLSIVTAVGFIETEPLRRVHWLRFWLLSLALWTLVVAWPLNLHVSELRRERNQGDPVAAASFGNWHAASLLLNFTSLGLVTAATAMAAAMPCRCGTDQGSL